MLKRLTAIISIMLGIFLAGFTGPVNAGTSYTVEIEPNLIQIGAGYNGSQIQVKGEIPKDTDIVIQVTDSLEDTSLLKKGHVFGVLWMNTGSITFSGIPKVYLLYLPGSIPVSALNSDETLKNLKAGFDAIERQTTIMPESENKSELFHEFLKLKTDEGLYTQKEDTIFYQDTEGGMKSFTCEIQIPCRIKQGNYTVQTFLLKDKTVVSTESHRIKIAETGFPKLISGLAFDHGVLYGVMATVIAIIAGLLIGLIFEGGGSH